MPELRSLGLAVAFAALVSTPAYAQVESSPVNTQIDYAGFSELVREVEPVRRSHRLSWEMFTRDARASGVILLDTRSAADFAQGHLRGAINLPFSEFTEARLSEVLGEDKARPIYIYCNNNFSDNRPPVMTKKAPLALNIPTFINLYGYGYRNVWELAEIVSTNELGEDWVSSHPVRPLMAELTEAPAP